MPKTLVHLSWERDGVAKNVVFPMTEPYSHKELSVSPSFVAMERGQLFALHLTPHVPVTLTHLSIHFTPEVSPEDLMMVNGYQTWTQSREMGSNEQIPSLRWFAKHLIGPYGDYNFYKSAGKTGHFHSWTYTYFRRKEKPMFMIGSIDESFAYTVLDYDFSKNLLIVEKEIERLQVISESMPFRLYIGEGKEEELWEEYNTLIPHARQSLEKCTGWTSWYYYYTKISQEILLENLQALAKAKIPLDVFQIDDGYQQALGDWLSVNEKFPLGMKAIASEVKANGYRPGIWLAPFVAEEKSEIYREHPEWLLRDEKGKPVKAGWNPLWSGHFYVLDFYAPGFQSHLRNVFETVLDEWGYEMVKLDFLYAVALLPRPDKTRGQIMSEAMAFIRQVVGERWILGCGVPLGPSFGQVEYCRIGSDVAAYWEDSRLALLNYRERVSTFNSLLSTIGRWQMNGRVFMNDPDVFILRDEGNKLNEVERRSLLLLNNLFGGLVFFSDNVREYSDEQMRWLRSIYPNMAMEIESVSEERLTYTIRGRIGEKRYLILANLAEKVFTFTAGRAYFSDERGYIPEGMELELQAHESICLYEIMAAKKEPFLLGTTGHIFPAAPVVEFTADGDNLVVRMMDGVAPGSKVYIGVPPSLTYIKVNGKQHSAKLNNVGARYISIPVTNL